MARKVSLNSHSVAYFEQGVAGVDESGFYLLEGTPFSTEVEVKRHEVALDHEGNAAFDERGRLAHVGNPEVEDTIKVKHETNLTPGRRVFPSEDGEGFVYGDEDSGEEGDN